MPVVVKGQRYRYKSNDNAYDFIIEIVEHKGNIVYNNCYCNKVVQTLNLSGRALFTKELNRFNSQINGIATYTKKEVETGDLGKGKLVMLKNQDKP